MQKATMPHHHYHLMKTGTAQDIGDHQNGFKVIIQGGRGNGQ